MNSYYAAWRAECCKADIEMGFLDDGRSNRNGVNAAQHRKEYQRAYMKEWSKAHKKPPVTAITERRNKKSDTAIV